MFYAIQDIDAALAAEEPGEPEPAPVKRGRGRPPKPEGALLNGPAFRLHPADIEKLAELAPRYQMPLRTFARHCLLAGLAAISGEAF